MNTPYSRAGSDAFNRWLDKGIQKIADLILDALGPDLTALLLTGEYGAGYGGSVIKEGRDRPQHNLEFLLITRLRKPAGLADLPERLIPMEEELGVPVRIARPVTVHDIMHWPCTRKWYDLLKEYRTLRGEEGMPEGLAPLDLFGDLPFLEGSRTLLDGAASLVQAVLIFRKILPPETREPGADIHRLTGNTLKTMGDSLLIQGRCYDPDPRKKLHNFLLLCERDWKTPSSRRWLPLLENILEQEEHSTALPGMVWDEVTLGELIEDFLETFLFVENHRTGGCWKHTGEYCQDPRIREETDSSSFLTPPLNLYRNLKHFRILSLSHPRERLFRTLPELVLHSLTAPPAPLLKGFGEADRIRLLYS